MTKGGQKVITKRSESGNKILKSKKISDRKPYASQRKFCKKLLRNTKNKYFKNLDIKKITDTRTFWKKTAATARCFK